MISVRKVFEEIEDMELSRGAAALDDCLSQVAAQHPTLISIGWCTEGKFGSVSIVRSAADRQRSVIPPEIEERLSAVTRAGVDHVEARRNVCAIS